MSGVDLRTAPFNHHSQKFRKREDFVGRKDHRAYLADASASNRLADTAQPDFACPARRNLNDISLLSKSRFGRTLSAQ
jgi:hypothetical protein